MNHQRLNRSKLPGRKLAATLLIVVCAVAAFATLGDGKGKSSTTKTSLLSSKKAKLGKFSLNSGYSFRGNQIINPESEKRYISLNSAVTWQKGNTTYVVPLKKKVALNNVKISIGNQQFQRF
jgi:ABC-type uncharacterized transport system ATPase subunit